MINIFLIDYSMCRKFLAVVHKENRKNWVYYGLVLGTGAPACSTEYWVLYSVGGVPLILLKKASRENGTSCLTAAEQFTKKKKTQWKNQSPCGLRTMIISFKVSSSMTGFQWVDHQFASADHCGWERGREKDSPQSQIKNCTIFRLLVFYHHLTERWEGHSVWGSNSLTPPADRELLQQLLSRSNAVADRAARHVCVWVCLNLEV